MNKCLCTFACCLLVAVLAATGTAQSLADKLTEEEQYYRNYGKDEYTRLKIEKDVIGHYNYFGEHITDGVQIYELWNLTSNLNNDDLGIRDSIDLSVTQELQKKDFYEKFTNLVVTQDAIGGTKTAFMIGDQITTKFTPLTFNKTNFKGIRWDLWSSKIQVSGLLSRTSPGYVAKKAEELGTATVTYPESFGPSYYGRHIRGDDELDFSKASPYGDFEWLWAFHAQNTIANKVDVGLSYINHHVSDVKKGEKWGKGNVPAGWMPEEIHFEFYDLTPFDTTDAGVYVDDVNMFVNGRPVEARTQYQDVFRVVYVGGDDFYLYPKQLPHKVGVRDGDLPAIVGFSTNPEHWQFTDGSQLVGTQQIKSISFTYTVAGNYIVFVSTDRQIPLCVSGYKDERGEVQYTHPQRSVHELFEDNVKINANGFDVFPSPQREKDLGATYFGNYIAKSPHVIATSATEFERAVKFPSGAAYSSPERYNLKTHTYEFGIQASSVTYGINLKGELGGVKFATEFALNQREDMLPGLENSRRQSYTWVGTLRAERELGKKFGLSTDIYHISPQWNTAVDNMQVSRYFSKTQYSTGIDRLNPQSYPDYLEHPRPFDSRWTNIDDNEDNDPYVESDRRRYPSEFDAKDDKAKFYADGTLQHGKGRNSQFKTMGLPTVADRDYRLVVSYDDPDGVVASRNDRNRNGIADYREDFLLFSSDPPEFELGSDLNNNGSPDYEDDDILPDYGYSVGYVLTSDGYKTLGIRGINLNLRWSPIDNTTIDVGGTVESVNDRDLVLDTRTSEESPFEDTEGRSLVGYVTAKREVLKRSQGIQYEIGNEFRVIRDGIRNDIVRFETWPTDRGLDVAYLYYTDPLRFRQALVDNLVGSIIYNNIPNFEYGFRLKLGVQKHLPLRNDLTTQDGGGNFYNLYTLYDSRDIADHYYRGRWEPYVDRTVGDVHVVNRVSYKIGFDFDYEDWRRAFNFLNRLEIIPQYKFGFSMKKELSGPGNDDPRNLDQYLRWYEGVESPWNLRSNDTTTLDADIRARRDEARIDWFNYEANNQQYLLNVPIIRMDYKIAENTKLQVGLQWKRTFDMLTPEESANQFTWLAQVASRASYKGYTVNFYMGVRSWDYDYDINVYNPVLVQGAPHDMRAYSFFAQIFSGI